LARAEFFPASGELIPANVRIMRKGAELCA
jgi:hypothetical protein